VNPPAERETVVGRADSVGPAPTVESAPIPASNGNGTVESASLALTGPSGGLLPRRGPGRALLKRLYYSWAFRTLAFWPLDIVERAIGRTEPLVPPRRLQYVGRGDFEMIGVHWRDRLIRDHRLDGGTDVLDIGCGVGRIAVALIPVLDEGTYEGFDIVPAAIGWCDREITSRHPRFGFTLADVRNRQYNADGVVSADRYEFPYDDERFDLALASSVFTHMRPDGIRNYLAETARVLRPGGRLACEFFIVDDTAAALLEQGRTTFALDHEFSEPSGVSFLGSDPRVPEYNLGIHQRDLEAMTRNAGLELQSIEFGRWSGRDGGPEGRFQDFVTLVKPSS